MSDFPGQDCAGVDDAAKVAVLFHIQVAIGHQAVRAA
jgi:hypothetical protein